MKEQISTNEKYDPLKRFKLTKEESQTYLWLKNQNLNTDENTLCYWVKKYSTDRVVEVTNFAKIRSKIQNIKNIGGWIGNFLKNGLSVVNDRCTRNAEYLKKFIARTKWTNVEIYEKHIRDRITDEDLPLTIDSEVFERSLEALYRKSELYK